MTIAFPFIEVRIDTSVFVPVAERAPGVIAVVGKSPGGATGQRDPEHPAPGRHDRPGGRAVREGERRRRRRDATLPVAAIAMLQDPKPTKIYGVRRKRRRLRRCARLARGRG